MMEELTELLGNGFFNDAEYFTKMLDENNGVVNLKSLERWWETFKGKKYTMKYFLTYGELAPTWGTPSKYEDPDEAEQLYKACLEEGVKWQEKLNYKVPEDGTLW